MKKERKLSLLNELNLKGLSWMSIVNELLSTNPLIEGIENDSFTNVIVKSFPEAIRLNNIFNDEYDYNKKVNELISFIKDYGVVGVHNDYTFEGSFKSTDEKTIYVHINNWEGNHVSEVYFRVNTPN